MALDLEAIGREIGPIEKQYNWKDVVLYALGVGAGFEELDYVYEARLKTLPSFAVAAVLDFIAQAVVAARVDVAGLLHGAQDTVFHHPLPTEGKLITTGRITDICDKGPGKGALLICSADTSLADGPKLFTNTFTAFCRNDGGFGGQAGPVDPVEIPPSDPDISVEDLPSPNQPLLYRLSGDLFGLHVDPDFARSAGFERPIMHGLCTHGYACRALINRLMDGKPKRLKRLKARFAKALYPGAPIATQIWKTGEYSAVFRTINAQTGQVVLDKGLAEWRANETAVGKGGGPETPDEQSPVAKLFAGMTQSFQPDQAQGMEAVFHFQISGPGGGDWTLEIVEGSCTVKPLAPENPSTVISMTDEDFVGLMTGQLDPIGAFSSGKLKVKGDIMKAALIQKLFKL